MKNKMFCAVIAGIMSASCSSPMYETLARTTRDPFFEVPRAQSMVEDLAIVLDWRFDEAADEYLLYRSRDDICPDYRIVYRGNALVYHDRFAVERKGEKYLYRLAKRRGGRIFGNLEERGRAALGVVSGDRIDAFEPNDIFEKATPLGYEKLYANGYFFLSNTADNISFYDEDWYRVEIRPKWKAQIILEDLEAPPHSTIQHFMIVKYRFGTETIATDSNFEITNPGNETILAYFRVSPDVDVYQNEVDMVSGGFGKLVRYTIRVASYVPLS
ncbi:MAG: hypothetical protein LBN92_01285 [Treponema sp.]|jgi:hypothetical protein|nr:hypothetical protein [Treponema sp.]